METVAQNIYSKMDTLNHIRGIEGHSDYWRLQTLIQKYDTLISMLNTNGCIDINKIITYIESLEKEFDYFIGFAHS